MTLSAWADGQWYFASRYWKDDSRAVVAWLAKVLPSGSTVLTAPNYVAGVLSYYATLQHAPIRMVGVDSVAWESAHPAALMLTRLHHVDNPEFLRSRFRELAASEHSEDTVGGYQILMRTEGTGWASQQVVSERRLRVIADASEATVDAPDWRLRPRGIAGRRDPSG